MGVLGQQLGECAEFLRQRDARGISRSRYVIHEYLISMTPWWYRSHLLVQLQLALLQGKDTIA